MPPELEPEVLEEPQGDMAGALAALEGDSEPPVDETPPTDETPAEPPPLAAADPATPAATPEPTAEPTFEERVAAAATANAAAQATSRLEAREADLATREATIAAQEGTLSLADDVSTPAKLMAFMKAKGWTPDAFARGVLEQDGATPAPVAAQRDAEARATYEAGIAAQLAELKAAQTAADDRRQHEQFMSNIPALVTPATYPNLTAWATPAELGGMILGEMRQMYANSGGVATPRVEDAAASLETQLSARVTRMSGLGTSVPKVIPPQATIAPDLTTATETPPEDAEDDDEANILRAVALYAGT